MQKYKNDIKSELNPLQQALHDAKSAGWVIFWFAFCINLLMLITPLYSLQVLDRVIGSGNKSTLLMLSIIIGLVYFVYGLLQVARSFTMIKIGEWLDNKISPVLLSQSIASASLKQGGNASQLLRDFQSVKTFLVSSGANTLLDAPWSLAYVAVIFMIHPYLGILTIIGGILVIGLALINASVTNNVLGKANEYSISSLQQADIANRNAEVIEAMGMMKNITANWFKFNSAALEQQSIASYRNGVISNFARFLRNVMQMAVTGIGAYVVIESDGREMTTGNMIASSIMVGRALAPFDNAIELWKSISGTMKSYSRINEAFKTITVRDSGMTLNNVTGQLTFDNVFYTHPLPTPKNPLEAMLQANQPPRYTLKGVSFAVQPGEVVAVIGASAAGKSTIAKVMTGVWKPTTGVARLDGADIYNWNREDFGKHVGYLPQGIELFSGTIKQNIARMSEDIHDKDVEDAAVLAGAHDMILKLPKGYDTDIGVAGTNLSGGQRQRIGLARAFFKQPKLLILDEPNANLDEAGEIALSNALVAAKNQGMTAIVISHRPSVLLVVDKIMVIQDGVVVAFGSKEEIMGRLKLNSGQIHIN